MLGPNHEAGIPRVWYVFHMGAKTSRSRHLFCYISILLGTIPSEYRPMLAGFMPILPALFLAGLPVLRKSPSGLKPPSIFRIFICHAGTTTIHIAAQTSEQPNAGVYSSPRG